MKKQFRKYKGYTMRTKDRQVNIRISNKNFELLEKVTEYERSEIIEMFLDKYYNTTPVGLAIKLDLLESELNELPKREIALKNEIKDIKNRLSKFNDLDLISDNAISLIKIAISQYLNKSIQYHNISEFLEENKELVNVQSNKTGYSTKDYKKLVIEYYNRYYA